MLRVPTFNAMTALDAEQAITTAWRTFMVLAALQVMVLAFLILFQNVSVVMLSDPVSPPGPRG
jgi:hypothetical protein